MVDLGPKTFLAGAAIGKYKIVKFGADDDHVVLANATAAAMTDLLGVTPEIGADAAEDPIDVQLHGQVLVEFGGTVARGAAVNADASGDAIAAGTGEFFIGYAMQAAVSGDIGYIMIARGQLN
jgi:hypothetical protein